MRLEHQHLAINGFIKEREPLKKEETDEFVSILLKEIGMKPLGPLNWATAEDLDFPGQSFVQMITTSHCSLHYFSDTDEIYFDLYSCRKFDDKKVLSILDEKFKLKKWHGIAYSRKAGEPASVMEFEGRNEDEKYGN